MKYRVINENYKSNNFIDEILSNRGITKEDAKRLLDADERYFKDPFKISGMKKAVDFFLDETTKDEITLGILVDPDVDGYSSSSLLYRFIVEDIEIPEENVRVFFHLKSKQHGLDSEVFDDMLNSDVDLFIIADSSTNDIEQQKKLLSKGKNVIILDHHKVDENVPNEVYLVNNQLENSESTHLSGVGIVCKFIEACGYNIDKYMDIVAVGIVADSMNMLDMENRAIVNYGLSHLENDITKEFFKEIKNPTITNISWGLANYMNSVIRFGKQDEKELLWKVLIGEEGTIEYKKRDKSIVPQTYAEALRRIANNVRSRQNRAVKDAVEKIKREIYKYGLDDNKCIVMNYGVASGIRGLVAQKLTSEFKRPCMLLSSYKNILGGSARSPFEGFKEMVNRSNLVEFAQGHSGAFGVNMKEENVDKLVKYLNEEMDDLIIDEKVEEVDYIFNADSVTLDTVKEVVNLDRLWGKGIQEPMFIIKNLTIESKNIKHKKSMKGYCTQFKYKGVYFNKNFSSQSTFDDMTCAEQLKFGRSQSLNLTLLVKFRRDDKGFIYIDIVDFNSRKSNKIIF